MSAPRVASKWQSPLALQPRLDSGVCTVQDGARTYCQEELSPRLQVAFHHEETDPSLFRYVDRALIGIGDFRT